MTTNEKKGGLVLTRKPGESITAASPATGEQIIITVCYIEGGRVKLHVSAPNHYHILRNELIEVTR